MHWAANDAFRYDVHPLPWHTLCVKRHGPAGGVDAIVPDGHQGTHGRLAHNAVHPAALVLHHLRAHAVGAERFQHIVNGVMFQHHRIIAGL